MISRFLRALGSFAGPSLSPAAQALRQAALIALAATLVLAAVRILLGWRRRRYGWRQGLLVECPRCGRRAADAEAPRCPEGHEVVFPRGEAVHQRRRRMSRAPARAFAYAVALDAAVAGAAVAAFLALGLRGPEGPLPQSLAALAFLFALCALYALAVGLSPRARGIGSRLLHLVLAAACALPALVLALLACASRPPAEALLAEIWGNPAGVYLRENGRTRRVAPASAVVRARTLQIDADDWDYHRETLLSITASGTEVPWPVRGAVSRFLVSGRKFLGRHGFTYRNAEESITLSPNRPVAIRALDHRLRFVPE